MKEKITDIKKEVDCTKKTICIADSGYHSELEIIKALKDELVNVYIPNPKDVKTKEKIGKNQRNKTPLKGYEKEVFSYDKEKNVFICPKQKILKQRWKIRVKDGLKKIRYHCNSCNECDAFGKCTTDKNGRIIEASVNFEKMQEYREKVESDLGEKIVQKRKELVEHPFGTIKRNFGYTYFMQTGIEKIKAEFSFIAFIYNLKRVINIVGVKKLIEALN